MFVGNCVEIFFVCWLFNFMFWFFFYFMSGIYFLDFVVIFVYFCFVLFIG